MVECLKSPFRGIFCEFLHKIWKSYGIPSVEFHNYWHALWDISIISGRHTFTARGYRHEWQALLVCIIRFHKVYRFSKKWNCTIHTACEIYADELKKHFSYQPCYHSGPAPECRKGYAEHSGLIFGYPTRSTVGWTGTWTSLQIYEKMSIHGMDWYFVYCPDDALRQIRIGPFNLNQFRRKMVAGWCPDINIHFLDNPPEYTVSSKYSGDIDH